jgi:hypothetical protein
MTREQQGVCDAIAKHFGYTKARVKDQAKEYFKEHGGDQPVMEIYAQNKMHRVGVSKNTLALGKLLFAKYFKKSDLYSDVLNLINNDLVEVVALYSGGALLAITMCEAYDGSGGVFVKVGGSGFAIEPFPHYLERVAPVYMEE